MAASDATPVPIKNQAYRVTFPIFDADGDLVSGAAGLDSEYSGDAGTFADCTNEATEIATSSGMYYLDLEAAEMNYDTVAIIVKTTTTGAKTTPIVLYPVEDSDIPVHVKVIANGAITENAIANAAITAAKIATDAITSDELATSALNEIADTILARGVGNVEDSADPHSLCAIVLATLEWSLSGTTWTIKKVDGATTFVVKTITKVADAEPVTGVT